MESEKKNEYNKIETVTAIENKLVVNSEEGGEGRGKIGKGD